MGLMCIPKTIERAQAETKAKVNIHYTSPTHNSTTSSTMGPEFSVELRWERRGAPVDSLHSKNTWSAQASTCRRMPRYVNEVPISLLTSPRASISLRPRSFFLLNILARPPQKKGLLALAPFIFDSPRAHSFPVAVALTLQPPPSLFSSATGLAHDLAVIPLCVKLLLISAGPSRSAPTTSATMGWRT